MHPHYGLFDSTLRRLKYFLYICKSMVIKNNTSFFEYLRKTFYFSNHVKYRYLFEEWVENITAQQARYYLSEMKGSYGCWFNVDDEELKMQLTDEKD